MVRLTTSCFPREGARASGFDFGFGFETMNRLRGSAHGRIDDKGRLKIPASFRSHVEERYGKGCFITSRDGKLILVFPLPVWTTRCASRR